MAITEEASRAVYATTGYERSVGNLASISLATDNIFSDGYDLQLPDSIGDVIVGYALTFSCSV